MIVATRKATPKVVAATCLPRAMCTVDAIARSAGALLYWQTATACRAGDALPADATAFKGEAVTLLDATGTPVVTAGATTVPVSPAKTGLRSSVCDATGKVTFDYSDMKYALPPHILPVGVDTTDPVTNPTLIGVPTKDKAVYQVKKLTPVSGLMQAINLAGVTVWWEAIQRV